MRTICEMLFSIEEKAPMFIGKRDLVTMRIFIIGFMYYQRLEDPEYRDDFYKFQRFVEERYKKDCAYDIWDGKRVRLGSPMGWNLIIQEKASSDAEAFATFYQLVHEFYEALPNLRYDQ